MPEIWQGAWKLSPLQDLLAFRTADQTKFGCYIFVQVTVTGSQSAALFGTASMWLARSQRGHGLRTDTHQRLYNTDAFKCHRLRKFAAVRLVTFNDFYTKDQFYWYLMLCEY